MDWGEEHFVDETAARNGPFQGLRASGGYIITLMDRLSSPHWRRGPFSADSTGRGVVTILNDLVNHEGALVFRNEAVLLVATRPRGVSGD